MKIIFGLIAAVPLCACSFRDFNSIGKLDAHDSMIGMTTLVFEGSFGKRNRSNPWSDWTVLYRDGSGKTYTSSIPLEGRLMTNLLKTSNYNGTKEMTRQMADIFFQGGWSACPDGDSYSFSDVSGSILVVYHAVDSNGFKWILEVTMSEGKVVNFKSKKTPELYEELRLVG